MLQTTPSRVVTVKKAYKIHAEADGEITLCGLSLSLDRVLALDVVRWTRDLGTFRQCENCYKNLRARLENGEPLDKKVR